MQKSIKSNEHVNITIQIIKVTFQKMKLRSHWLRLYSYTLLRHMEIHYNSKYRYK